MTVEKRFKYGLGFNFNYTYQKALGDDGDSYTFIYNRPLGRGNRDNITSSGTSSCGLPLTNCRSVMAANSEPVPTR